MNTGMVAFATALFASVSLAPAVRQLAFRLDPTQPDRQGLPLASTPLVGGLAMYAGASLATVLVTVFFVADQAWPQIFSILTGATLMVVAGMLKDHGVLNDRVNTLITLPTAAFLLVLADIHTTLFQGLLGPHLPEPLPLLADYLLTFLWVIGVTLAFNIFDHMDGLCTGVSAVIAAFFSLFAVIGSQILVGTLATATFGASVGFLYWNLKPARFSIGNGGSMFLGFTIAVLGLKMRFIETPDATRWLVPLLLLGVVLFDLALITTARLRQGQWPVTPPGPNSRDHTVHRLIDLGLEPRSAVLALYGVSTVFGMLALLVSQFPAGRSYALCSMVLLVAGLALGALQRRTPPRAAAELAPATPVLREPLLKRPLDLLLAAIMILLALPVACLIAAAIKLEDGGPIFFRQRRWGRGGSTFCAYKFRTMVPHADRLRPAGEVDDRVTRIGKLLRATGLDELPQVLNIWRGEMSFVGPRALAVGEIVQDDQGHALTYTDVPGFWERLAVRPGLTSIATIYLPKDAPAPRKFRYDRFYIRRMSLGLDLGLIGLSYWISFRGKWETRKRKV